MWKSNQWDFDIMSTYGKGKKLETKTHYEGAAQNRNLKNCHNSPEETS